MYRLLIVDDEHHIVDWLYELFQGDTGIELDLYKAYTARGALAILEQQRIDIVLTDIRMPGMDGLELAETIQKQWPGSQVIFLTGYDEFDYVYRANQLGNIRYLLKTEEDDVIVQAVKNAAERMETQLRNRIILQEAIDREQVMNRILFNQEICNNLYAAAAKPKNKEPTTDKNSLLPLSAILLIAIPRKVIVEEDLLRQGKLLIQLQELSERYLSAPNTVQVVRWKNNSYLWLIQPQETGIDTFLFVREALESFAFSCREALGLDFFFVLRQEAVLSSQIVNATEQMCLAAQTCQGRDTAVYILNAMQEQIIHADHSARFHESELKKKAHQLGVELEQGNEKEFWKNFSQLESAFKQITSFQFLPAIELYKNISLCLLNYVNRHLDISLMESGREVAHWGELSSFSNWEEAIAQLHSIAAEIFAIQKKVEEDSETRLISSIKHYIQNHINGDLGLVRIAEFVRYNPSYVSRQFRQAAGMTLLDYITQVRIERAKDLLLSTEEPVQKIAALVGFDSAQYFSTVFKKHVGITPNEYRNH